MKALIDRILKDGKCYPGGILKVDKFINHQMDPNLMKDIAVEFIRRFASTKVNKILTIEASGIAPAIMMGFLMNLPVVFAKKKKPNTLDNMLATKVTSFTKQRDYDVVISRDYLCPDDHVIFIDDFLAYGNAAKGRGGRLYLRKPGQYRGPSFRFYPFRRPLRASDPILCATAESTSRFPRYAGLPV